MDKEKLTVLLSACKLVDKCHSDLMWDVLKGRVIKGQHFKIAGDLWAGKLVIFPNLVLSGPAKPIGATGSKAFWDQTLRAAPESPKSRSIWDQREKNFGGVPYVTQ